MPSSWLLWNLSACIEPRCGTGRFIAYRYLDLLFFEPHLYQSLSENILVGVSMLKHVGGFEIFFIVVHFAAVVGSLAWYPVAKITDKNPESRH